MSLHPNLLDHFTDQSPFDIVWQAAVGAALVHHSIMKIPQKPDTALAILPSLIFANMGFIGIIAYKGTALISFGYLLAFNFLFCSFATILQIFHNVYFRHRDVPGSFWYMATDLIYPSTLFTFSGRFNVKGLRKLQKMHAEMGDVIRIQPNHISFNNVDAIEDVHGLHSKLHKLEPYKSVYGSETGVESIFTALDKGHHDRLRRVMRPVFSTRMLDQTSPIIEVFVQRFVHGIGEEARENNGVAEIRTWLYNFAYSVIGSLALGNDLNGVKTKEPHEFVAYTVKFFKSKDKYMFLPWLATIEPYLPNKLWHKPSDRNMEEFAERSVRKKLEESEDHTQKTILSFLREATDKDTGEGLQMTDLVVNSTFLLAAGSQTTANSLIFILRLLLHNTRTLDKLCIEVRNAFKSLDEITSVSVRSLQYLEGVLLEGLRCGASFPFGTPRITPPEGAVINGIHIPGNTYVSIPNFVLQRDVRNFSDPESFIPERWIATEKSGARSLKKAMLGFGHGPRECLGRGLAVMEIKMVLAALVWQFDIELADGPCDPLDDLWAQVDPLKLRVRNWRFEA